MRSPATESLRMRCTDTSWQVEGRGQRPRFRLPRSICFPDWKRDSPYSPIWNDRLRDLEFPEKVLDGVGLGECCGPFHERRRDEPPSHKNKRPRSENCLAPMSTPCGSNRALFHWAF